MKEDRPGSASAARVRTQRDSMFRWKPEVQVTLLRALVTCTAHPWSGVTEDVQGLGGLRGADRGWEPQVGSRKTLRTRVDCKHDAPSLHLLC